MGTNKTNEHKFILFIGVYLFLIGVYWCSFQNFFFAKSLPVTLSSNNNKGHKGCFWGSCFCYEG